mgnify:CR=1 FL=1|tara:strand:- start:1622 stop:1822 length:201 start_codon:yes stop_codon:yes gene_type:complete
MGEHLLKLPGGDFISIYNDRKPNLMIFLDGAGGKTKPPPSIQVQLREAVLKKLNELIYVPTKSKTP